MIRCVLTMIASKEDMHAYLRADAAAHGIPDWKWWYRIQYPVLAFQRLLRKVEYYENCHRDPIGRLWRALLKARFRRASVVMGFTIPPNTCGPGLAINHWGTIVISPAARIGRNCRLNICVNIGLKNGAAPTIGDNTYIGPGAKLFGGIHVGSNVSVGANAVVNRDVPDNVSVAGVPARIIGERASVVAQSED